MAKIALLGFGTLDRAQYTCNLLRSWRKKWIIVPFSLVFTRFTTVLWVENILYSISYKRNRGNSGMPQNEHEMRSLWLSYWEGEQGMTGGGRECVSSPFCNPEYQSRLSIRLPYVISIIFMIPVNNLATFFKGLSSRLYDVAFVTTKLSNQKILLSNYRITRCCCQTIEITFN